MDFSIIKKITDFIMPLEPIEEEEQEPEKKVEPAKQPVKTVESKAAPIIEETAEQMNMVEPIMEQQVEMGKMRSAEGGSVAFGGMKYTAYMTKETEPVMNMKPQLKVIKGNGITVKINKPTNYEDVKLIADELLKKCAVVVNYELVDKNEQQKITDFVNGVCYATDGRVEQISERIVLYMPEGIDAEAAFASGYMR